MRWISAAADVETTLRSSFQVGYALFAVALGVFVGALTRKTQAAKTISLVGSWTSARLLKVVRGHIESH